MVRGFCDPWRFCEKADAYVPRAGSAVQYRSSDPKRRPRLGYGAAKRFRFFKPAGDRALDVARSLLAGVAVGRASGKVGDRRKEPAAVFLGKGFDHDGVVSPEHSSPSRSL